MFNIQCLTSEPNQKWKKANMHSLDQFATHSPEKFCHIKWRKKTLFWRSRDHLRAILGVLISVWNLVKPSMFTTQCTSSFSSSCICAAQPRPPVVHMQWHPLVAPRRLLLGVILGYSLLGFYLGASCGVTFHVTNPLPASVQEPSAR